MTDAQTEQRPVAPPDDDEDWILNTAIGYRHSLVMASLIKRWLAIERLTAGAQLECLEALNKMTDGYGSIPAAVLARIEPADDVSAKIIAAARSLDGDDGDARSFEMLTSHEVFRNLARLNPTIMDAVRSMRH